MDRNGARSLKELFAHSVSVSTGCYNKAPRANRLEQHTFLPHTSRGWEVQHQGAGGASAGDGLLPGLRMAVFLLLDPVSSLHILTHKGTRQPMCQTGHSAEELGLLEAGLSKYSRESLDKCPGGAQCLGRMPLRHVLWSLRPPHLGSSHLSCSETGGCSLPQLSSSRICSHINGLHFIPVSGSAWGGGDLSLNSFLT